MEAGLKVLLRLAGGGAEKETISVDADAVGE